MNDFGSLYASQQQQQKQRMDRIIIDSVRIFVFFSLQIFTWIHKAWIFHFIFLSGSYLQTHTHLTLRLNRRL